MGLYSVSRQISGLLLTPIVPHAFGMFWYMKYTLGLTSWPVSLSLAASWAECCSCCVVSTCVCQYIDVYTSSVMGKTIRTAKTGLGTMASSSGSINEYATDTLHAYLSRKYQKRRAGLWGDRACMQTGVNSIAITTPYLVEHIRVRFKGLPVGISHDEGRK